MRNFIKVFLFLIFGTTLGMDGVFPQLKNEKSETVVVFDCDGVVFSYIDSVFSDDNKDVLTEFSKKRENLDREINGKIDRALFYAPKRIVDVKKKQDFKNLVDQGIKMIFVYQINEDLMKFRDEWMIQSFITSVLGDIGLDPKSNPSVKFVITDSKNISADVAKALKEIKEAGSESEAKNEKRVSRKINLIKKVILVHEGNLKLDKKQIKLPIDEILLKSSVRRVDVKITKEEMMRQMEILEKTGEWMDDFRIQRIMKLSDEELVYELCKQSIMDVCPCSEIIEDKIFEKIASLVKDKKSLENLRDIIDDFQEIYNTMPNVYHYVFRVHLWEACLNLGLKEEKVVEILKKMERFYFNEHEARGIAYKVLKNIGCGVHWKDMAKYDFIRNFLMTNERVTKEIDSSRYKSYMKVLNIVFDRVNSNISHFVEDKKAELIKILHENKVEDKKIIDVFKISEEKLKNITGVCSLKNEEGEQKDEKKLKKTEKDS